MPRPVSQTRGDRFAIGRWRRAGLLWLLGATLFLPVIGGQVAAIAPPGKGPPDPAALLATVTNPAADRAARTDAALLLLSAPSASDQIASIASILSDPLSSGAIKTILLDAITRCASTPPALFEPVAGLARAAGNEDLPLIAPALGSFRTRESARLLVGLTGATRPPAVRNASFSALARLSGRDDLGTDAAAWQQWMDSATILSEAGWQEQLATDQARRADRLSARLGATQQELGPIYRRLYGQLSPAERPRLLAEMLKDEREELRALGFQLAALELSSGQTLPAIVSDIAISLLADGSPATRTRAAILLDQVARDDAKSAVIDALTRETDPEAASALLAAAARWPTPVARATILAWLSRGDATRPAAAKAALALLRAGLLNAQEDRAQAAAALRRGGLERLGVPELRLLVSIGTERDRRSVAEMLDSSVASRRLAAAEALSGRADSLSRLLAAAALDPDLFQTVAECAAETHPTAATYSAVAGLAAPSEQARRSGLMLISQRLSPNDLLIVARETTDTEFAAALLERLPEIAASADADAAEPVALGTILVADLRLRLGQPDRALAALDLLDTLRSRFPNLPTGEAADLRATAYLCLDRVDRALATQASPAAWLRGLSLSKVQPHAGAIAAQIRTRFAGRLTPDQMLEFALLESQIAAREQEEARNRMVGPPAPDPERGR